MCDRRRVLGGEFHQVAFVTGDLDAALNRFETVFPGRRWRIYTFDSSRHATAEYQGTPTSWLVRIALGDGSPQVELVEPVSATGIHREWGSGFGIDGSGAYAYVDTAAELGYLVELLEPPTSLGEPDAIRGS